MKNWIGALTAHVAACRPAILVSVAAAKGSVPRRPGTRMIVTAEKIEGTIGGGHLEHKAIEIARDLIAARGPLSLHRVPLGASLGQCCGGVAQLLFEPVHGNAAWLATLAELRAAGRDCALVVPVRGDASGGRLVVTADDVRGTLGSTDQDREAARLAYLRHDDRLRVAEDRAAALEPKLARLQFVIPKGESDTPGLEIRIDGAVVDPFFFKDGIVAVEPGAHTVEATAGPRTGSTRQR